MIENNPEDPETMSREEHTLSAGNTDEEEDQL
jgi:hypothetical protein